MASIVRQSMLRQRILSSSKRVFSATSSTSKALSSYPLRSNAFLLSKQTSPCKVSSNAFTISRVAAFHASARRDILPQGPQVIKGTMNDPAPVPHPSPTHGSYHWTFERAVSVGLIPLTITPFAVGSMNPTLDALFCAMILIHSHIGFSSMVTDYFPTWEWPKLRKLFEWVLRAATLLVGVGLYEFSTNDVGLTEATKRIWKA